MAGKRKEESTCSFNLKTSMLAFSRENPDIGKYKNAYIRLYCDPAKQALAWKFVETGAMATLEGLNQVKDTPQGVKLYVPRKMTEALRLRDGMRFEPMAIGRYTDSLLDEAPYYHVTLTLKK